MPRANRHRFSPTILFFTTIYVIYSPQAIMTKSNRKIVVSNAYQAAVTILERRGITCILTGDMAAYLHGSTKVPLVSGFNTVVIILA